MPQSNSLKSWWLHWVLVSLIFWFRFRPKIIVEDLRDEIRLSIMPFPPIIFARSLSCLIAQTYISSHPASGLFLISPPLSNASVSEALPSKLPEFNFESKFPIAIMATEKEMKLIRDHHRFGNDPEVDTISVADLESVYALAAIEEWLDLVGVWALGP